MEKHKVKRYSQAFKQKVVREYEEGANVVDYHAHSVITSMHPQAPPPRTAARVYFDENFPQITTLKITVCVNHPLLPLFS